MGDIAPDLDDAQKLKGLFAALQRLNRENLLLAYHDRSDGGLFATIVEMCFAGHTGVDLEIPASHSAFSGMMCVSMKTASHSAATAARAR